MPVCRYPMSGMADVIVSPSSSSSNRSTPCVDGCCGPMLRVMRRSPDEASASGSAVAIGLRGSSLMIRRSYSVAGHRVVFPQRMSFPIIWHQDAPQIRMIPELDPEQVECFPLKPVGRAPDTGNRVDFRILAAQPALQPQTLVTSDRLQVIDHLEAGFGRIQIHSRQGTQPLEW